MSSMEKKLLKIALICFAVFMVVIICIYANAFLGNPISKALATKTAKNHIAETYPNEDYIVEYVEYLFKPGKYYAHISSTSGKYGEFDLVISPGGELIEDRYKNRVYDNNTSDTIEKNVEIS